MKQCYTPRQRQFVDLAATLADEFATRAAEHDRDGTFPFENYERMKETGYLGLSVPAELGGMGASLLEMCLAQERLAQGCASTALAVTMHISPIGQQATLWQAGLRPELEGLLRGAASGDVVYASMSAEPGHSILTDSSTIMTKVDGGYRVSGHKVFGTGSAVCTSFSTMGRYEDPVDGPQLMFFVLPRHSEGVIVHDTWDTMGMRATRSNEFDMEHVFIPEGAVFHSLPIDHYDATLIKTVWGWSMPVFGSVYLGIAAGAIEQLRKMVLKRHWEQRPEIQRVFADMEVLLETARAVIRAHAEDYESGRLYVDLSVQQAMSRAVLPKYVATNNAVKILDLVMQVAGGSGFFKPSPLERAYRDVRAGTVHPYNNFEALNLFGKTSLEIEIRPSVEAIDSPLIQRIVAASS
ncbi:MAG TPA: acyl-CoA dehydrogenase family protein [Mycobacterium sp.]|jgi:alkylation response protein AidB-like acyl-CoA dehydrogenase|nr:acyl-CoA dehydrogenase family protein [Mycobacterium sp.]